MAGAPAAVNQQLQIGVEATAGTAPAGGANKLVEGFDIDFGMGGDIKTYRSVGRRFTTVTAQGKEWSAGKIKGELTYTEIVYLLSSMFGAATIAQQGATTAYQWSWNVPLSGAVTPTTLEIMRGTATQARQFDYGLVTGLNLKFDRDKIELDGDIIGQLTTTGATLTASPVAIGLVPVVPNQVSYYLDTTGAGIGSTQLTDVLSCEWSHVDAFGMYWPMNRTNTSFASHVDMAPKPTIKLMVAADTTGEGLVADGRSGVTKFLRIGAQGALIATPYDYTLNIDLAVKMAKLPTTWADKDGVYAVEYEYEVVEDATWNAATKIAVINTLTTL